MLRKNATQLRSLAEFRAFEGVYFTLSSKNVRSALGDILTVHVTLLIQKKILETLT
jgi:hypothetical protein